MAVNRPFKNGFLLKGAYTFSKALNETDDDGWTGVTWNQPSQLHRNYARGGLRPSAHAADGLRVRAAVRARTAPSSVAQIVKNWQINGIASYLSGTPFTIGGDNGLLQQVGGQQTINVVGDAKPGFGEAGPNEQWYDPAVFAQPGKRVGQQRPQRVPRTVELEPRRVAVPDDPVRSLRRLEFRIESQNVLQPPAVGQPGDRASPIPTSCASAGWTTTACRARCSSALRFAF